jgi:integrase
MSVFGGWVEGLTYAPFAAWITRELGLHAEMHGRLPLADLARQVADGAFFIASLSVEIRYPDRANSRRAGHLLLATAATSTTCPFTPLLASRLTRPMPTPVPPTMVEQLRARLGPADALMVSVLAYAGLRPQELLALQWNDIHERAILVRRKNVDGQLYPYTKTRQNRRVKLLAPLAGDLRAWKLATGRRDGLVVPRTDGEPWRDHDYRNWRRRVYRPAAATVGLASGVPYDLRGSFVSLLAWEGQNMLEVARQAGHSVAICERHYAGIFEDYDPANRTSAETAIRAAREPGVRAAR